jgi:hypothetical protein
MIYFTSYAEKKFDILNKHQVYIRREQVEEAVRAPEIKKKKGKYFWAEKQGIAVIYKLEGEIIKIITFFPTKQ